MKTLLSAAAMMIAASTAGAEVQCSDARTASDMLISLARKGRYAAQIAREMGVSEFGIHRAAKRLGIELTKGRTGFKVGGWKP